MKFLEALAKRFADAENLREMCFVFPNRRSALFFQRYLGIAAGHPLFSPCLKTIDDLFEDISHLQKTDKIESLYLLYRAYVEVSNSLNKSREQETFDQFVYWGDIILRDFDDIDKYLIHAEQLLLNIKELRDLSVEYDFLSQEQKNAIAEFCNSFKPDAEVSGSSDKKHLFNETWNLLLPLYLKYRDNLLKTGKGYPGMIYRNVAEMSNLGEILREKYSKLVFVGLNALNECEKVLLSAAQKEGIGDFYWDFYGPMLTDKDNRSSRFVAENMRNYPSLFPLDDVAGPSEQSFEVVKVPSGVGQTRVAKQILDHLHKEGRLSDPFDTAIVLPDESLLSPMLGALPDYVDEVNVTMGYPLNSSSVSSFFTLIERLQSNAKIKKTEPCFYHRDVIDLLEHPFFVKADVTGNSENLKKIIVEGSLIFIPQGKLIEYGDLYSSVFRFIGATDALPVYQMTLIEYIQQFQSETDREFLYCYHKVVSRIRNIDPDLKNMQARTYFRLLAQCVALISIPYRGEPLRGLQIMGPLETRGIDFKNLIMLSISEGSFPSKNVSASFIPYNLRKGFGLPTYEFQDSIWAYHFYRSIYRAQKIFLIYDSRSDGLQSGEESRYIKQLRYIYKVPIKEVCATYSLDSISSLSTEKSVVKDAAVIRELNDKFIAGRGVLSSTSLNCYLNCPLQFYYKHVKGFKQQNEVIEDLDSSRFGTVFHAVMENIYKPYVGKEITPELMKSIRNDKALIESLADRSFAEDAKIREISGQNLILKQLILKFVDRVLEVDSGMVPFVIKGTETPVEQRLSLPDGRKVRLFGSIDRLDSSVPGIVRVVDYKTGRVEGKENCDDVDRIFDAGYSVRPDIAFQLYFYSFLAGKSNQCVYALQSIFTGLPETHVIEDEKLIHFKERLESLVAEVFNPDVPFVGRSTNGGVCDYCNFKRICRKQ